MPPVRPKDGRNYRAELALATLQGVLGVYATQILRLTWWGQIFIVVGSIAGTSVFVGVVTRRRHGTPGHGRSFVEGLVRVQVGALKWLVAGLPGVAVTLLAFGTVWIASGHSCAAPGDLRILTAEENIPALTDASSRYVAERSGDGCRNAIVTISAGSATQDIETGFTRGWRMAKAGSGAVAYYGPRPDVWIPDTTAAAVEAQNYVGNFSGDQNDRAVLDIGDTVGTSPMVVAVFGPSFSPPGSVPGSLDALSGALSRGRAGVPTRPPAKTSEAALAATPVLS